MSIDNNTIHRPITINLKSSEYSHNYSSPASAKSDILFVLNNSIKVPPNVNIYFSVGLFRFINSFYNIPTAFSILSYAKKVGGVYGSTINIQLDIGNYDKTTIINSLNGLQDDITFSYNSSTKKVTATNKHSVEEITMYPSQNSVLSKLGFSSTENTVFTTSSVSSDFINLVSSHSLFLVIEDIQLHANGTLGYCNRDILEHIPVTALAGNSQSFQSLGIYSKCDVKYINQLRIKILDSNNNLVDFQNVDWYLTLYVTFQYDNEYRLPTNYLLPNTQINLEELTKLLQNENTNQ